MTPFQQAYADARESGDLSRIVDLFMSSQFFVVAGMDAEMETPVLALSRSPDPNRLAVTAAEDPEHLSDIPDVVLIERAGRALLDEMRDGDDLVIIYEDGGELLSADILDWLRFQ